MSLDPALLFTLKAAGTGRIVAWRESLAPSPASPRQLQSYVNYFWSLMVAGKGGLLLSLHAWMKEAAEEAATMRPMVLESKPRAYYSLS